MIDLGSIPKEIAERILAAGPIEWGATDKQTDEQHVADMARTLELTRKEFATEGERELNGVYLKGTNTVLAHTGTSPNSPMHAKIITGLWNQLHSALKAQAEGRPANDSFVDVSGLWLCKEGEHTVVKAEVGGQWIPVIRERSDGEFSHIVEASGISALYYHGGWQAQQAG